MAAPRPHRCATPRTWPALMAPVPRSSVLVVASKLRLPRRALTVASCKPHEAACEDHKEKGRETCKQTQAPQSTRPAQSPRMRSPLHPQPTAHLAEQVLDQRARGLVGDQVEQTGLLLGAELGGLRLHLPQRPMHPFGLLHAPGCVCAGGTCQDQQSADQQAPSGACPRRWPPAVFRHRRR